jgi:hypothetical protein
VEEPPSVVETGSGLANTKEAPPSQANQPTSSAFLAYKLDPVEGRSMGVNELKKKYNPCNGYCSKDTLYIQQPPVPVKTFTYSPSSSVFQTKHDPFKKTSVYLNIINKKQKQSNGRLKFINPKYQKDENEGGKKQQGLNEPPRNLFLKALKASGRKKTLKKEITEEEDYFEPTRNIQESPMVSLSCDDEWRSVGDCEGEEERWMKNEHSGESKTIFENEHKQLDVFYHPVAPIYTPPKQSGYTYNPSHTLFTFPKHNEDVHFL